MKSQIAFLFLIIHFVFNTAAAQVPSSTPWQQRDRANIKPLDYEYVREADVMWSKNIWRIIDVRQKLNKPFSYPQMPLIQIIHEASKRGDLTVYDPSVINADQFVQPMSRAQVVMLGERRDTVWQPNIYNPDVEEQVAVYEPLRWERITKFKIKEVWFFDTKLGAMQVRIIAIAPVMEDYDLNGNYRGDMTMYWIPYAGLRPLLATREVFNEFNDSQRFSWDDLFNMRKFQSYIYKESNVYDRAIQEYAAAVDAQLESDRIKQELMEKEHDMWNY